MLRSRCPSQGSYFWKYQHCQPLSHSRWQHLCLKSPLFSLTSQDLFKLWIVAKEAFQNKPLSWTTEKVIADLLQARHSSFQIDLIPRTATTTHGPPGLPPPHYQCITTAKVFAICGVASANDVAGVLNCCFSAAAAYCCWHSDTSIISLLCTSLQLGKYSPLSPQLRSTWIDHPIFEWIWFGCIITNLQ